MKDEKGTVKHDKAEIVKIVQDFYSRLYASAAPRPQHLQERGIVKKVDFEEIPEIAKDEIRKSIAELKSRKSPGKDRVTTEMLKSGGEELEEALRILFNKCVEEGQIPMKWRNAKVILLFKKRDAGCVENYRLVSLLTVLYKLFTKIITKRFTMKLDFYQSVEQAEFRSGYSTIKYIHAVRTLIEKSIEYNIPLCLAYVDYHKAFDPLEVWAILEAMKKARIHSRYSNLIQSIYENATL